MLIPVRYYQAAERELTDMVEQNAPEVGRNVGVRLAGRALIVGLGNPGRRYRHNRHNVGFMVADRLAEAAGISLSRVQNRAILGSGLIAERPVIIAKPQTYMNLSGGAVQALVHFYQIALEDLLVIYDELDLPFGALRLRGKGGAGGHNGMRSIIQHLGQEFPRLRIGIGRPPGQLPPADYVLQDFGRDEAKLLPEFLEAAARAAQSFLIDGIDLAMTRHNGALE